VRGFLGASSVILRYYALEYLSIADTSVITYATPVLVTVMAHFVLGEKMGIVPVLAAILTFGGVVVMTRPPFLTGQKSFNTRNLVIEKHFHSSSRLELTLNFRLKINLHCFRFGQIGIALACGSLLCASLIVIITRKIRKVHFSVMTLAFGFIGLVLAFILAISFGVFQVPTELSETLLIFGLMSLAFIGQMAIVLALILEQVKI